MNKYCVSFISFNNNEMVMKCYTAKNELDAADLFLRESQDSSVKDVLWEDSEQTLATLKEEMFNMDSMIGVLCVD